MKNRTKNRSWLEELPGERARLVRFCARLTGSYDAAEDLAQETLFEAWRQAGNLRDPAAWRAFVSGIARNVCLRWRRERGKESAYRAADVAYTNPQMPGGGAIDSFSLLVDTALAGPDNLETTLEQAEITSLLDKALGQLPEAARQLLIERYVDEASPKEMAERRALTENALGVRLHRARLSLQKLLALPPFREDAASYGLISTNSAGGWQETRIWCPRCGRHHLEGRFITAEIGKENTAGEQAESPEFAVRCPECEGALGLDFSSGHPGLPLEQVLGDVRGFKPALNRLSQWWNAYYSRGVTRGRVSCPVCAREAAMTSEPPIGTHPLLVALRGAYIYCQQCGHPVCVSPSGIAYHLPAVQRFWKDHPKMALTEEKDLIFSGVNAVAVSFQSLTSSELVEVILSRRNFETLHVSTEASGGSPTKKASFNDE